jgi:hypothetical protein
MEAIAMKVGIFGLFGVVVLLVTAVPATAHHSFAAEFDSEKPIELRGTLVRMDWVNPHGWIYIDVKNPDGNVTRWAIEAGGATGMLKRGLRKTDFQMGTEVIVKGYLARSGKPVANGRSVTMADGRNFFLGATDTPDAPR